MIFNDIMIIKILILIKKMKIFENENGKSPNNSKDK